MYEDRILFKNQIQNQITMSWSPPQQQQQMPTPTCAEFFKGIPFWYIFLGVTLLATWILSTFLLDFLDDAFSNHIEKTIFSYQIWRLFLNFLCQPQLFLIVLFMINLYTFFPAMQNRYGSAPIISIFILTNFLIQIITIGLQLILYYAFQIVLEYGNSFVGIWLNLVYKFCYYNPAQMKLCCFNLKFKRSIYPFVWFAIISIFQFQVRAEAIAGLSLAIIQCAIFNGGIISFSCQFYKKIQNLANLIGITKFGSWVPLSSVLVNEVSQGQMYQNLQQNQFVQRKSTSTQASQNQWQGKFAYRLDGSDS